MNLLVANVNASLLIMAVICMRKLLSKRIPRKVISSLWAVAVLRLLVPYTPSIGLDAGNTAILSSVSSARSTGTSTWLLSLWLVGAVITLLYFGVQYIRSYGILKRSTRRLCSPLVASTAKVLGIRRKVYIAYSDEVNSPMTLGVIHPYVIIPIHIDIDETDREYGFVITHELTHVKRYDSLTKILLNLAICMNWFNPLVYVMARYLRRDIELACDEQVLSIIGRENRRTYAESYLSFASPGYSSAYESQYGASTIKERIISTMNYGNNHPKVVVSMGVVIIAIVLCFSIYISPIMDNKANMIMDSRKLHGTGKQEYLDMVNSSSMVAGDF